MRVLKVSDIPYPEAVNGISIYLDSLAKKLGPRGVSLAYFSQGRGRGKTRLELKEEGSIPRYSLINSPILFQNAVQDPLSGISEPRTEAAFRETLAAAKPDIVHFHEFVRTPASLIPIARDAGARVAVTLHDYWLICPRLILFTPEEEVCPGPQGGKNCVLRCLGPSFSSRLYRRILARGSILAEVAKVLRDVVKRLKREPLGQRPSGKASASASNLRFTGLIEKHRLREEAMMASLNSAHLVLPVSRRVGEIFEGHGLRGDITRVMNLGLPGAPGLEFRRRSPGKPLRFGFLGHLGPAKGSHLLVEAAARFSKDDALFIFYGGGDEYATREIEGLCRSLPQLSYRGPYRRKELGAILGGLDVVVTPSICEETMGLVAMEGLASGAPVVGSRIGGLTDYIVDGVNGLLFSPGSARELADIIASLIREPERVAALSKGAEGSVLDMDTHADRLVEVYRGLLK